MQVAHAELVGVVDDYGVGIGDVQAGFDDVGTNQHIVLFVDEVDQGFFEFVGLHLAVCCRHFHIRAHAANHHFNLGQVFDPIVYKKHLTAAVYFVINRLFDDVFAKNPHFGVDGLAVGWRGANNREVAGRHQGKLQGAGDWGSSQSQGIHIDLEIAQFFLGSHPEFLLLIDDQQAQIFKFHLLIQQGVGANDEVNFSLFELLENLFFLRRCAKAVDVIHRSRKFLQAITKGFGVLQRKDGGRHQYRDLFAVQNRLKCRPDRYLGFTKTHVATDQAIHRIRLGHVGLGIDGGLQLVGGIFVDEGGFQLHLHVVVGGKSEAGRGLALGVEFDQFASNVLDFLFGFGLEVAPGIGAQLIELRGCTLLANVLGNFVQGVDADVKQVVVFVHQPHTFLHVAIHIDGL